MSLHPAMAASKETHCQYSDQSTNALPGPCFRFCVRGLAWDFRSRPLPNGSSLWSALPIP